MDLTEESAGGPLCFRVGVDIVPIRMRKPCAYPGCPELVTSGYCDEHKRGKQQEQDRQRGSAHQRGYTAQWQKARLTYLRGHPLCAECEKEGRLTPATELDHIKPHKGNMDLFWDFNNVQGLCRPCHSRKTAKEDGGFGNNKK